MTPDQLAIVQRVEIVYDAYNVKDELEALPKDNVTISEMVQRTKLTAAWAKALAHDLTPPESIPIATDRACVARMVEHANIADSCANKAQSLLAKPIGPKQKTLREIIESIYVWAVLLNQELAVQSND